MTSTPPTASKSGGSRPVAFLAVTCVAGLAIWWGLRVAEQRALEEALLPYAETALPAPGAPVDAALADVGARVFEARCTGCHAVRGQPKLGPNLAGITLARDLPWIRSMVTNPDSMTRADPIARALLQAYGVPMQVVGGMDGSAARAVIEFLRRADGGV